jgi:hypothetical protein
MVTGSPHASLCCLCEVRAINTYLKEGNVRVSWRIQRQNIKKFGIVLAVDNIEWIEWIQYALLTKYYTDRIENEISWDHISPIELSKFTLMMEAIRSS